MKKEHLHWWLAFSRVEIRFFSQREKGGGEGEKRRAARREGQEEGNPPTNAARGICGLEGYFVLSRATGHRYRKLICFVV